MDTPMGSPQMEEESSETPSPPNASEEKPPLQRKTIRSIRKKRGSSKKQQNVFLHDGMRPEEGSPAVSFPLVHGGVRMESVEKKFALRQAYLEMLKSPGSMVPSDFLTPGEHYTVLGDFCPVLEETRSKSTTGLGFAPEILLHFGASYHPEQPARVSSIVSALKRDRLWERLISIDVERATRDHLILAHQSEYVDRILAAMKGNGPGDKMTRLRRSASEDSMPRLSEETYINESTPDAVLYSCGTIISCIRSIMEKKCRNAMSLVRPPGHHALAEEGMGFCLVNNCVIGALTAMRDYPESIRKVLIIDWDVHHGNGIQDLTYDSDSIMYISIHRYDEGDYFPYSGHVHCTGAGAGAGFNINIPLNLSESGKSLGNGKTSDGYGDMDYMLIMQNLVMPIAMEFDPDLVLVAAGFDAAKGDPLGGFSCTRAAYAHMTSQLKTLADGNVVVVLEGGYNCRILAQCCSAVIRVLMGEDPPRLKDPAFHMKDGILRALSEVSYVHKCHWKSLYGLANPSLERCQELDRMVFEDKKQHENPLEPIPLEESSTPSSENKGESYQIEAPNASISPSHQLEIGSEITHALGLLSESASCSRIDQLHASGEDDMKLPEDKITSMGEEHEHQDHTPNDHSLHDAKGEETSMDTSSPSIQEIEKNLMDLDLKTPPKTD
eukprot:TRINITY_DN1367_c0_g1_i1.p1 TRINITY_DN1367_c0_g1~~TRINITY_DN1367_c0_g1_i1.p1  ORF type:complete len:699 (+),score=190.20 TRINITY_DN1367_c0_g1_i1:102-2099(+)